MTEQTVNAKRGAWCIMAVLFAGSGALACDSSDEAPAPNGGAGGTSGTSGDGGLTDAPADAPSDAPGDGAIACEPPSGAAPGAVVASCPDGGAVVDIFMNDFSFGVVPSARVGDIVRVTNGSTSMLHTVTSGVFDAPDGWFDTGDVPPGGSVCLEMKLAGCYRFYCAYHTVMQSRLVVTE
jgi:plastocyanin